MDRIFVSIASYRDNRCPTTLNSLFKNAKNPERIYVGICQQNKPGDIECVSLKDPLVQKYISQIRIKKLSSDDAKGPTLARYICSKLWNGEEYYLQIDSHTLLVKDWDEKLKNMVNKKGKAVISHYPPAIEEYDSNKKSTNVPRICRAFFNERGMISFEGAEALETNDELIQVPYIAAGLFFCKSDFLKELPFDPDLPYLFVGEEILLSIRFWTNGWDIYTPSENIVYHYYTRSEEPKIWTDKKYTDEDAHNKVKEIIGIINSNKNHEYGIGNIRKLEDYYKFAGIDINSKTVSKDFCRKENSTNKYRYGYGISISLIVLALCIIIILMYVFRNKLKKIFL